MVNETFPYSINQIPEIEISYKPFYNPLERRSITDSFKSYTLFKYIRDKKQLSYKEHCVVAYMNNAREVIGICRHSIGSDIACTLSIKQILAAWLKANAKYLILAHNHTWGNTNPSNADIQLTWNLKYACQVVWLKLVDHIIINESEWYFSMSDECYIENWYS